jgi:hypothetical protein
MRNHFHERTLIYYAGRNEVALLARAISLFRPMIHSSVTMKVTRSFIRAVMFSAERGH